MKAVSVMAAAAVVAILFRRRAGVPQQMCRVSHGVPQRPASDLRLETVEPANEPLLHQARLIDLGATASMILHELRQPLFTIGLAAENGLAVLTNVEGEAAAAAAKKFQRITTQVDRMMTIIPRLLAYSRPADDPASLTSVHAAIDAATTLMSPVARDADIRLVVDTQAVRDAWVQMNQTYLEQVIVNALRNAFDACGAIARERGQREVRVVATCGSGRVTVDVEDTGPGLAPEAAKHAFDAFYTTKDVGKGTGLGLHICRLIVARAGGTATLCNRDGGGARFRTTLPLVDVAR